VERGKPERKPSQGKGENQQQTQSTYGVDAGIWTQATLVGGECSHHCAILVPLCFPLWVINDIVEYHCSLISAPSPFWELARAWNWGPSEDQVCLCPAKEERLVECDTSAGEFFNFNSLRSCVTKSLKIQIMVTVTNLCGSKTSTQNVRAIYVWPLKNSFGKCSLFVLSANGWKDQNMASSFSRQRKP